MPSYRTRLVIGDLRDGTRPEDVLPFLVKAMKKSCVVEFHEVIIDRGRPCTQVRFLAGNDAEARESADSAHESMLELAEINDAQLFRRHRTRWIPV